MYPASDPQSNPLPFSLCYSLPAWERAGGWGQARASHHRIIKRTHSRTLLLLLPQASTGALMLPPQSHPTPQGAQSLQVENIPCYMCGKMLRAAYILGHMKVPFLGPHHVCECNNKDTFEDSPRAAGAVAVTVSITPTPQLWAPCQGRGDAPGALRHSPHSPAELHLGVRESGRGRKVP